MSKPMMGAGVKATLPSNIIRPGKIKFKEKFKMDMPDEKESGLNLVKKRNYEVESLIDHEIMQNRIEVGIPVSQQKVGGF